MRHGVSSINGFGSGTKRPLTSKLWIAGGPPKNPDAQPLLVLRDDHRNCCNDGIIHGTSAGALHAHESVSELWDRQVFSGY